MRVAFEKIISVFTFVFFILIGGEAFASSDMLPVFDDWQCGDERSVELTSLTGVRGVWCERAYRTSAGRFKAVLMTGNGPKFFNAPSFDESRTLVDGVEFSVVRKDGRDLYVETHPLLGCSVSVKAGPSMLTLESSRYELSADDMQRAALRIAAAVENAK